MGTPDWPREKEDQSKNARNHGPVPAGAVQDNFQRHAKTPEPFGTVWRYFWVLWDSPKQFGIVRRRKKLGSGLYPVELC